MTARFVDFNLADLASIDGDLLPIYLYCLYGFMFSILLTGMFEGFMFSYAILKNDILGIDDTLRRSMSWGVFVFVGAVAILIVAELYALNLSPLRSATLFIAFLLYKPCAGHGTAYKNTKPFSSKPLTISGFEAL